MTAPFDGVVLDVTTEVGEWVTPSPPGVLIPPVIDVIDPDSLYVSAPLDEADVARVHPGLPVRITMDAFRGQVVPRHALLRVVLRGNAPGAEPHAHGGGGVHGGRPSSQRASRPLRRRRGDPRCPRRRRAHPHLRASGGEAACLVVRGEKLESVEVKTGLRNWEFTEVTSGLDVNDRVVVSLDRPEVKAGARSAPRVRK